MKRPSWRLLLGRDDPRGNRGYAALPVALLILFGLIFGLGYCVR